MKKCLITILFATMVNSLVAQNYSESFKRNTFFIEVGGNSPFYSLNYDRIIVKKINWKLAARIGAMYLYDNGNYLESIRNKNFSMPLELSFLKGKNNHNLEIGIGATPFFKEYVETTRDNFFSLGSFGRIGYRYQKTNGGIFFKAGFTPLIRFKKDVDSINPKYVSPWAGLAIGYTLKN